MRVLVSLLTLSALVLAGCLQSAAPVAENSLTDVPTLPGVPKVSVYNALGQNVTLPEEFVNGTRIVQRLLGVPGAEPNVGITSSGAIFVSAYDYVMRSRDNGLTWEKVYEFGPAVAGVDAVFTSDPMLWVDPVTDRIFVPTMFPVLVCSQGIWSDDDGETWFEKPYQCGQPVVDHQKLATGPYSAETPKPLAAVYPNVVYYCYNKLATTSCAVSFDGGLTFPVDQPVSTSEFEPESQSIEGCAGVNGHPAAAPDGTVYVPIGTLNGGCGRVAIGVSTNNGLGWTLKYPEVGDLGQEEIDPDITVTPDGTAYYFWRAAKDHRTYMIRSTDRFETVEGPFLVSPPDVTTTRFAVTTSGDDGRVAFAYLGTRDTSDRPRDAPDDTRWHLFVTFSLNAADENPTFTTFQVTPEDDPIQVGYMWEAGGGDPARNLLDFIDLHVGPEGRVVVAFADGCTKGCAGNPDAKPDDSRDDAASIAILEEGPSLYAAKGHLTMAPAAAEE